MLLEVKSSTFLSLIQRVKIQTWKILPIGKTIDNMEGLIQLRRWEKAWFLLLLSIHVFQTVTCPDYETAYFPRNKE